MDGQVVDGEVDDMYSSVGLSTVGEMEFFFFGEDICNTRQLLF